jgi:arabinogalactan oligomer/maltooligosaccharide transport system permease protein
MAASDQTPPSRDKTARHDGGSPPNAGTATSRSSFPRWFRMVGWRHLVGLVGVLFALFPVVWMVSASINPIDTLSGGQLIPDGITLDNYRAIFDNPAESPFMTWLWNSYYISFIVATVSLVLTAMAAFAFSRFRFRGRRLGLLSLLAVQIFPQFLAFVAIFLILDQMGDVFPAIGLDTHPGLMLVYLGGAIGINTFLIKGFMDSVPESLDESARVDGASPWTIFWRIILPLTRPALVVIFIITFVYVFNEFILARTLLTSVDQQTYIVGLQTYSTADYASKWGQLAAGAMIGSVPIVLTFLIFQRGIVSGLTQGAVKG